jgi:AraC family transcriptional regulator
MALLNDDTDALAQRLKQAMACLRGQPDLAERHLEEAALLLAPPPAGALPAWRRRLLAQHIEDHLDGPLRTQALAQVAGVSVSALARGFKASFGCSPQNYIQRRRVARAKLRMCETTAALAEIALECGFADQTHLSRAFRRETGSSPARWRSACIPSALC